MMAAWLCSLAVNAQQRPPPPGRLVDVGGYRLHIDCRGIGRPVVILDSGAGGFSLEWIRIQEALSREHRVCSYDRAGYGWSDIGPLPRTSDRIARELKLLLSNSHLPGPYILVGHSFGGFTAQYFAREFPEATQAIVLIESSHPQQANRLPAPRPRLTHPPASTSWREGRYYTRSYTVTRPVLPPNYPTEVVNIAWPMISSRQHVMTWREEMMSLALSGARLARARPMPNIPVVVITRGKQVWPANEHGSEMERVWMELQDELSVLSADSIHLIAERSGHLVHLDQPEYVLNALTVLLDKKNQ